MRRFFNIGWLPKLGLMVFSAKDSFFDFSHKCRDEVLPVLLKNQVNLESPEG
jgi:hypothetical protein